MSPAARSDSAIEFTAGQWISLVLPLAEGEARRAAEWMPLFGRLPRPTARATVRGSGRGKFFLTELQTARRLVLVAESQVLDLARQGVAPPTQFFRRVGLSDALQIAEHKRIAKWRW